MRTCVLLGRTWLDRSELGMVSQGTRGVVIMGSQRFPGRWEGEIRWVRIEEFDEIVYLWVK